jgi:hypothetical protein
VTEFAPSFPDLHELFHATLDRLKEMLLRGQEPLRLEIPESDIALQGLYVAEDKEPKRIEIPAEDPEEVKKRDRVTPDTTSRNQNRARDAEGGTSRRGGRPSPAHDER